METNIYEAHNQNVSSNFLSPTRVQTLSSSQEQTKIEKISLPSDLTYPKRYIYIMVLCLVLGEEVTDRFIFDISVEMWTSMKISHLRDGIKEKASLSVPAHKIKLWKVAIPTKDMNDEKMKILINKSHESINVKEELGGELLDAEDSISSKIENVPADNHIHIIVEPPKPATTGLSSISKKRKGEFGEFEFSNRKSVNPIIRNFWLDLCKAQIILKLPDYVDKNIYSSEPYSRYMRVVGNDIVLNEHIMLDSNNKLIRDNGEIVSENITMNFLERNNDGTEKLRPLVKFLRFNSSPKGIIYGISTQEILIKTSYLQMIEVIENDRGADKEKVGCTIIGSPGIGKTHFSLYLAFYITRRHSPADFIYQQLSEGKSHTIHVSQENANVIEYPLGLGGEFPENSFYIADSVIPSLCTTKFTFLVTTPKNDRWHEFDKQRGTQKYYAPIWTDEEIWDVWEWDKRDYKNIISKTRVEELITRWGCVPRRIFNEYNKEPKIGDIVSKCNAFRYLTNDGGDLNDKYSGKAIHIYPSSDFKDKEYVIASAEISRALYDHYAKNSKNIIVDVVRNFAKTAGGPLAGKLFEMMAHDILRKGGKFKVRRLTKDSHEDPDERFPVEELSLKELMHKQFRKIDEISSECYNIPDSPNFKSIDSIAPDCDGTHYLYQVTIADKHSIKVKGLSELESKINDYQPIKLYFVVPNINNLFDDFCEQKYVTTTDTEYVGWDYTTSWIKQNLTQYVLKIDLSDF